MKIYIICKTDVVGDWNEEEDMTTIIGARYSEEEAINEVNKLNRNDDSYYYEETDLI